MENIKNVPTPVFGNYQKFTEMAVITVEPFMAKTTIDDMAGYTATVEKGTSSSEMNHTATQNYLLSLCFHLRTNI